MFLLQQRKSRLIFKILVIENYNLLRRYSRASKRGARAFLCWVKLEGCPGMIKRNFHFFFIYESAGFPLTPVHTFLRPKNMLLCPKLPNVWVYAQNSR